MIKLEKIKKDEKITVAKKTKLVYFFAFPIVTFGSESWILRKVDQLRLNAFEMWTWSKATKDSTECQKNE